MDNKVCNSILACLTDTFENSATLPARPLTWSAATLCNPPRVSKMKGMGRETTGNHNELVAILN
jgi:hypothetical protein